MMTDAVGRALLVGACVLMAGQYAACSGGQMPKVVIGDHSYDAKEMFPDPAVTPIAEAIAAQDSTLVAQLLAKGTPPDARGKDGMSLLLWALLAGDKVSFQLLLSRGASPDATTGNLFPTSAAAATADPVFLKLLLEAGANPNSRGEAGNAAPPLFRAVERRLSGNTELLLKRGADPNFVLDGHRTALILAVQKNDRKSLEALLAAGADPTEPKTSRLNALDYARNLRRPEFLELMTKRHGTNPNGSRGSQGTIR